MASSAHEMHGANGLASSKRYLRLCAGHVLMLWLIAPLPWLGCLKKALTPLEQAEAAIKEGEFAQALQLSDGVLQLNPDDPDGLVMRGRALVLLERWEDALASFNRAIELRPEDYDSLYRREHIYKKLGKDELAKKDQELAKSLDPTYKTAYAYEPGTFIHRPAPPPTPKGPKADDKQGSKTTDPVTKDDPRDTEADGTRDPRSRTSPRLHEDEEENQETAGTSRDSRRQSESADRDAQGTGARRSVNRKERSPRGEEQAEEESPLTGRKRKPIGAVRAEPLKPPAKSWESEPEEAPAAPLARPPLSTALPVPQTEFHLQGPTIRSPNVMPLPTTGLQHNPRPTSPFGSPYSTQPQGPYSTGLPVQQHPSLPLVPGRSSGLPPMQMTTGLPHRSAAPGLRTPGAGYSPIPGTATGPLSEYLNRLQPRSNVPVTGSGPISTSLPGSAPLHPTGVITSALPGSEVLPQKPQSNAPISSALPESASPPR